MSEFARASQLDIIAAYKALVDAVTTAAPEDKESAVDDLGHFLRMNGAGQIQEWFANRKEQAS